MSAKTKTKASWDGSGAPLICLICVAIKDIKGRTKGVSRAAIANYLRSNFGKKAGGVFNAHLRNALKKGIESGTLKPGATNQRFKLGDKSKLAHKAKKSKAAKKKPIKKKTTKKKKIVKKTSKKKVSKKKVTKKKPTKKTQKKKVTKRKTTKKRPAKKTTKRKVSRKKTTKKSKK